MQTKNPPPPITLDTGSIVRYFQLDRKDLVYLRFIQEAYEGLSFMSTADRKACIVRIAYQPSVADDMEGLLDALAREMPLTEVAPPEEEP